MSIAICVSLSTDGMHERSGWRVVGNQGIYLSSEGESGKRMIETKNALKERFIVEVISLNKNVFCGQ